MIRIQELFKIGIGPSSSHTVGPMTAANRFLGEVDRLMGGLACVTAIHIHLYGSLSATGKGHATDSATILGLMGYTPTTVDCSQTENYLTQVFDSGKLALAGKHNIAFDPKVHVHWHNYCLDAHPNAMTLVAQLGSENTDPDTQASYQNTYYSVGGGFVLDETEIATNETQETNLPPHPFGCADELLALCDTHKMTISEIMLANECHEDTPNRIYAHLDAVWSVMQACVEAGCHSEGILPGGLGVRRRAKALYETLLSEQHNHSAGNIEPMYAMDWVDLYALAVNEQNAGGGQVVTAPTNGAAGVIPAVLHYYRDFVQGFDLDGVRTFLLTAGAVGVIIKQNASFSGAEVGCQGEVGSACAMAAAGLTAVTGGTPAQCLNAAEIGLEHNLGLTCDPVGGLVQVPCIERNAMAAIKAINAARLAMRGDGTHIVSLDKAIATMKQTGLDMMDKYKETSRGGLAITLGNIIPMIEDSESDNTPAFDISVGLPQC